MKNIPTHLKVIIGILAFLIIIGGVQSVVSPGVNLYNATTKVSLDYDAKVQEQISNYDGYYNAFMDKQQNANINKETFIEVTNIIMQHRQDGQNLAWKWLQENQNIPYSEFTQFYKELSVFISERYADNMRIEREKQQLVRQHNEMLKIFPNNVYNSWLDIEPLKYQAGYISDSTRQRFK